MDKRPLPVFLDRCRPSVRTIEFEKVEGTQRGRVVILAIPEQVEDGEAALVHDDGLAVSDFSASRENVGSSITYWLYCCGRAWPQRRQRSIPSFVVLQAR